MKVSLLSQSKFISALGFVIASTTLPNTVLSDSLKIEEIVVTAQKRAESSQDIPVAITAIQSETIENLGLQDFKDLTKVSSSLSFQQGYNKQNSPISLRGIGALAFSMSVEPSVAVIIDDVTVANSAQALSTVLSDIERVEVLRGPQSTLFGKSASAGVVNIATKGPSEDLEGSFEYTVTDDDEDKIATSVSGMLTDTLGVRASAFYSDYEGFVKNLGTNNKVNGGVNKGIRAKLIWEPSDDLTVSIIGNYAESNETCCSLNYSYLEPGAALLGFFPSSILFAGVTPSKENDEIRLGFDPVSDSEGLSGTLKINYSLGEYNLISITGYHDWEYLFATNNFLFFEYSPSSTDQFSQEFRLVSPASERFEYVAGLYYSKTENYRHYQFFPVNHWEGDAEHENRAIFGQATFGLTENLSLTVGLRYNEEDISADFQALALLPPASSDIPSAVARIPAGPAIKGQDDDSVVTGKLSLQYRLDNNIMLFGGYTRGYKGQAHDITSSFSQGKADNPVRPETSDAFEIGIKSLLFDNRLQLNATLFFNNYDDFQAQGAVFDPNTGFSEFQLENVGELQTSGLEIDAIALISENLRVNIGLAYIDAEIEKFTGAPCYSSAQTVALDCIDEKQDLSGEELNNSPDFKLNLAAEYSIPLESQPFDAFIHASYNYQSEDHFSLLNDPDSYQGSYGVTNMSLGIISKNDKYRVTLFVNNLFDERYATERGVQDFWGGDLAVAQTFARDSFRHAGLRIKANF